MKQHWSITPGISAPIPPSSNIVQAYSLMPAVRGELRIHPGSAEKAMTPVPILGLIPALPELSETPFRI
jgi:hypothetical protein